MSTFFLDQNPSEAVIFCAKKKNSKDDLNKVKSILNSKIPTDSFLPSIRYQTGVLRYTNSDFLCDLCGKIRIFRCVRVVFRNFCYHGVITVFLVFLAYFFLHS